MKHIFIILFLLLLNSILFSSNKNHIYANKSQKNKEAQKDNYYNERYIKKSLNTYLYRIPVVIDDLVTLIGLYTPKKNVLILEYMIEEKEVLKNIEHYNEDKKDEKIKNPFDYIYTEEMKKQFLETRYSADKEKCFQLFEGKNIFHNDLIIKFNYYMGTEFYTSYKLSKEKCI